MNQPRDYYRILGVPEDATAEDIKRAFRRLAFQHHPDRNPGREAEAAERFKEVNEAYCVLNDPGKRREYNAFRKAGLAGAGYAPGHSGFQYTQDDILRSFFSNRAFYEDLNRMFAQAGLRFDADFLNRTFFSGRSFVIQFGPGTFFTGFGQPMTAAQGARTVKPGIAERAATGFVRFVATRLLPRLLGVSTPKPTKNLDLRHDVTIGASEAASGTEKRITYRKGRQRKQLMVKIPAGITSGTRIRLRGMGRDGSPPGDLYIYVNVK